MEYSQFKHSAFTKKPIWIVLHLIKPCGESIKPIRIIVQNFREAFAIKDATNHCWDGTLKFNFETSETLWIERSKEGAASFMKALSYPKTNVVLKRMRKSLALTRERHIQIGVRIFYSWYNIYLKQGSRYLSRWLGATFPDSLIIQFLYLKTSLSDSFWHLIWKSTYTFIIS